MTESIVEKATKIAKEFELPEGFVKKAVDVFIKQADESLEKQTLRGLPMIPSYVSGIPKGTEKGVFLAIDLGGTNFRVCSVTLNGDSTFDIIQSKKPIPDSLMKSTSAEFISHLGDRIQEFIETHCCDTMQHEGGSDILKMGYTFSFPVNQTSINRGTLIRWTKGYDIKDMVGKDIVIVLQEELDRRNLPIHIAVLLNDTVGTLMSRAYTKPETSGGQTLIGCIFGTGTNGAYSEKVRKIKKFTGETTEKIMVINTEWGSFDNDLTILPNTKYDKQVNINSPNPDFHLFEKRVSGMYLGELLRLCMADLGFQSEEIANPWSFDTMVPSVIDGDEDPKLEKTGKMLAEYVGLSTTSLEERKAVRILSKAIGRRSAHLSAIPCAGLILHTKALEKFPSLDIGGDGSVIEFYPNFQKMMHEALAEALGKEGDSKITIGIAKDGSGVGAALCAYFA